MVVVWLLPGPGKSIVSAACRVGGCRRRFLHPRSILESFGNFQNFKIFFHTLHVTSEVGSAKLENAANSAVEKLYMGLGKPFPVALNR